MPKRKACFYGVRHGFTPGVYEDWEDCKRQVTKFPGNEYKSFSTRAEAENYVYQNSTDCQGATSQEKETFVKKDVRNVRPKTTNFKEDSQQQFIDKIITPKKESSLPSKLSAVDRSNLVKLVEENGEQFFAFNSLKDFDLYFKSLAHSNCLDEVFKAPKEDHDTQELKANLNFSGMLERKILAEDDEFVYFKDEDELETFLEPYFNEGLKEIHRDLGNTCSEFRMDQGLASAAEQDVEHNVEGVYQIEFDGASKGNPGRAGAGALIRCPHGSVVVEVIEFLGHKTNNVAEYCSLILGLNAALSKGVRRVKALGDSKLVCLQVTGAWKVENEKIIPLFQEVKRLEKLFEEFSIAHVRREYNTQADALANDAVLLGEVDRVQKIIKPLPQCCEKSAEIITGSF